ncbi:MAG: transposase [Candidatus Methanoliparum thermophilum]|uniref:Transposase n=1 Tax=Methanoliparum thermophilum TaxID=2491083 RepID=A0A520KQY3_METT2|nr:MAG: transposase [Candidatus Methanoliparum thermophilum]BDC36537.1 transposase [Candidatus Methanoliparum sp. LAM-1]
MLSYRFRIYPSKKIEQKLKEHLELCRWLYNRLLEELNKAKSEDRKITKKETQALIVKLKDEKPELKEVYSKVLQMVNHQLWNNIFALAKLKKNGKKVGKLRFKGKNWFKTINYNQLGFRLEGKKLIVSKIGEIPIKIHRQIEGKIKGVFIKREKSEKWFAIFQVEQPLKPLPKTHKSIGIDLGIKHFLTDTDGRQIENPKFYEKSLKRIKIEQRKLSKKKSGSKNREKQRVKLVKAYERLVDQRDDFLHKLSRFYVNSYDLIAVENLNIRNMIKNHHLASKILDASWSKFLYMLSYKAEKADKIVVKVNPKGTSKIYKHGDLDRDYNASLNILERALSGLGQSFEPVEIKPLLSIPASAVITGQVSSLKQEAPSVKVG